MSEYLRREIEEIIARHADVRQTYETSVPRLKVARLTAPVAPVTQMTEACLCMTVRGSRELVIGDAVIRHDEHRYILSAIGLPAIVSIKEASPEKPYTALRIEFDLDLARQVMAEIDVNAMGHSESQTGAVMFVEPDLLDCIARLVRLIERPRDVAFMSNLLHRELLYRMLSGPGGGRLRQIVRLGSPGQRVHKAVAWLRAHFRDRLRIDQLADVAGMGASTLHRHFHEMTGMSPLQYQKHLRLHEARRGMLDERMDVGSAALAVGYESSTQFIREYRRLFGEPPMRDLKSLRMKGMIQQVL